MQYIELNRFCTNVTQVSLELCVVGDDTIKCDIQDQSEVCALIDIHSTERRKIVISIVLYCVIVLFMFTYKMSVLIYCFIEIRSICANK